MGKEKSSSGKEKKKKSSEEKEKVSEEKKENAVLDSFDRGRLFRRYCDAETKSIRWDQFTALMDELRLPLAQSEPAPSVDKLNAEKRFSAGMLFEQYNADKSGKLSKEDFEKLYQELANGKGEKEATVQIVDEERPSIMKEYAYRSGTTTGDVQQHLSPLSQLLEKTNGAHDAENAVLRRDFIHLQGLLEAILAPRIESEVRVLEQAEDAKSQVKKKCEKIESESRAELESMLDRLREVRDHRCSDIDKVSAVHRKTLDKISQFQYLCAGPRPRDALRMDSLPQVLLPEKALDKSSEDSSIASFRRQLERARQAFHEQERLPHPLVMRDFISLFRDFEFAAQKLVDTPYSVIDRSYIHKEGEGSPVDRIRVLASDALPRELFSNKSSASTVERLQQELRLKDEMIFSMIEERESFHSQKQQLMAELDELAKTAASEIKGWADMHTKTTKQLGEKIAFLQEQNRVLQSSQVMEEMR